MSRAVQHDVSLELADSMVADSDPEALRRYVVEALAAKLARQLLQSDYNPAHADIGEMQTFRLRAYVAYPEEGDDEGA